MYSIWEAHAIVKGFVKAQMTTKLFCHKEHVFFRMFAKFTNGIKFGKIENYLVQNVHTGIGKITWNIKVGKRERTFGDSKCKFKEKNHLQFLHTSSTVQSDLCHFLQLGTYI